MGLAENYVRDVWRQKKVAAVYPPGEALNLGDVYEYDDGIYKFRSTLKSRGVRVTSRPGPGLDSWDCKSKSTSEIVTKVKGKTPSGVITRVLGKADAGAVVRFTSADGYVLGLRDIKVRQVTNLDEIAKHLHKWFWSNDWDTSYLVVTEVWTAAEATILTSGSSHTQAELQAKADLKAGSLTAAELSAGFKLVDSGQTADHFVGEKLTPIFRAHRFNPFHGTVPAGRTGGLLSMRVTDQLMRSRFDPVELDLTSFREVMDTAATKQLVPFDPTN